MSNQNVNFEQVTDNRGDYIRIEKTETSTSVALPKEVRFTRPDLPGFSFVVPNGTMQTEVKRAVTLLYRSIAEVFYGI